MPQLHETVMGQKLIMHTLPDIAHQLKRIADVFEGKEEKTIDIRIKTFLTETGKKVYNVEGMQLEFDDKIKKLINSEKP